MKLMSAAAALSLSFAVNAQAADSWTLSGEESRLSYGSIKKNVIGEVNRFTGLTGVVSAEGGVKVDIDLLSVDTAVDIRNERMIKYVFADGPTATLTAEIDMDALNALAPGDTTILDVEGQLAFGPTSLDVYTEMFVARLGEDRVVVTTDEMIMLDADEIDINPAIDKLMEIADLPGITRVAPVTLRLVFNRDLKKAAAAKADIAG